MNTSEKTVKDEKWNKSSDPWKDLYCDGITNTYGMSVTQGVLIRVDRLDTQRNCTATSMTYVPFAAIIPKDQDTYQLISTFEAETERMMGVVGKTVTKLERDGG